MREAGEYHAGEVQASEISVNDVAPAFLPHQGGERAGVARSRQRDHAGADGCRDREQHGGSHGVAGPDVQRERFVLREEADGNGKIQELYVDALSAAVLRRKDR